MRLGLTLAPATKYAVVDLGGMKLVLERHTEFASYTFVREGAFDQPFASGVFDPAATEILTDMPGDVIRATQIALYPAGTDPPDEATLDTLFVPEALILCDVAGGKARVMSDFRLNPDGFGRLLLLDSTRGCSATSLLNSCCVSRNWAITATWRCSACRSRSG
jgi:uncharacterized membrane-anchored protein